MAVHKLAQKIIRQGIWGQIWSAYLSYWYEKLLIIIVLLHKFIWFHAKKITKLPKDFWLNCFNRPKITAKAHAPPMTDQTKDKYNSYNL